MIKISRFYGVVQGNRGDAHRGGSAESGMQTQCASWSGAVQCNAYVDDETGEDNVKIKFIPWRGRGKCFTILDGRIDGGSCDIQLIRDVIDSYLRVKGIPRSNIEIAKKKIEDIMNQQEFLEEI